MYETICMKLHEELARIEEKYRSRGDAEMSSADLEIVDKISHALKSLATYEAMEGAQQGNSQGGYSYRRGRDSMGRYTSRDVEPGRAWDPYSREREMNSGMPYRY